MRLHSKNITILGAVALVVAWSFDLLFWGKTIGISFPIFILLCLGAGFYLMWRNDARPAVSSIVLIAGILFFAWIPFLRLEPFTMVASIGLTLTGLIILSLTWKGGSWWRYDLGDYGLNLLSWFWQVVTKPAEVFRTGRNAQKAESEATGQGDSFHSTRKKTALSIFLGLILAMPLLTVLAALLTLADPIFSRLLEDALSFLQFEKLFEYTFRFTYILFMGYLLGGAYLYALLSSQEEKVRGDEEPRLKPFLGWVESGTILICVDALFAAFVVVQIRYFFGGRVNIQLDGYTYAEYARRGFGELVIVAMLSLLLLLGLSMVTRRGEGRPRLIFSILGIILVALVGVMLVSAYQRLLLYEAAYGFTRLRIYTHVFMIWLGVLLASLALLEAAGWGRYFAFALTLICVGFGATFALMNVDGTIVGQNVERSVRGEELDLAYLVGLSADATPYLFEAFDSPLTPVNVRDMLGGVLACRAELAGDEAELGSWPGFHWSRERAKRLHQQHQAQLAEYNVYQEEGQWKVRVGGVEKACRQSWGYGY